VRVRVRVHVRICVFVCGESGLTSGWTDESVGWVLWWTDK